MGKVALSLLASLHPHAEAGRLLVAQSRVTLRGD